MGWRRAGRKCAGEGSGGNETDSVSGYRYISLDTLQSFRFLRASSQMPLFFV